MDCSPPGFFIHGILQARILEWVLVIGDDLNDAFLGELDGKTIYLPHEFELFMPHGTYYSHKVGM